METSQIHIASNNDEKLTTKKKPPVITIDGPTSSGKGTMGKLLARKLQWNFLDSGALYRVLALAALQQNIAVSECYKLENLARNLKVKFIRIYGKPQKIMYEGYDVSHAIRQEGCGSYASELAVIQEVRDALSQTCQQFREYPGLIADGRDMGTVVFPDAELKIYLTASQSERALRRWKQLQNKGVQVSLEDITADLQKRDERDSNRAVAPLKPADDSIIVDTTNKPVGTTLRELLFLYSRNLT